LIGSVANGGRIADRTDPPALGPAAHKHGDDAGVPGTMTRQRVEDHIARALPMALTFVMGRPRPQRSWR